MPSIRPLLAVGLAALSLSGGGCALISDSVSVTTYRAKEAVADCRESKRNSEWARQAWANVRGQNPQACYSKDYAAGFEDGFANYLYRGGNGEPPPLPPRHYRSVGYQTPQGYRAIEDWFAGYRHGAGVAKESGYRQWVTGPMAGNVRDLPVVLPVGPETVVPEMPPAEPILAPKDAPADEPNAHARILGVQAISDPPEPSGPPPHARILGAQTKPEPPATRPDT
jgi:hypothetical protein